MGVGIQKGSKPQCLRHVGVCGLLFYGINRKCTYICIISFIISYPVSKPVRFYAQYSYDVLLLLPLTVPHIKWRRVFFSDLKLRPFPHLWWKFQTYYWGALSKLHNTAIQAAVWRKYLLYMLFYCTRYLMNPSIRCTAVDAVFHKSLL